MFYLHFSFAQSKMRRMFDIQKLYLFILSKKLFKVFCRVDFTFAFDRKLNQRIYILFKICTEKFIIIRISFTQPNLKISVSYERFRMIDTKELSWNMNIKFIRINFLLKTFLCVTCYA